MTLDGEPLAEGTITFMAAPGSAAGVATGGGSTISNGSYSISQDQGLVPGTYNVAIYAAAKRDERTKPEQVGVPSRLTGPRK